MVLVEAQVVVRVVMVHRQSHPRHRTLKGVAKQRCKSLQVAQ